MCTWRAWQASAPTIADGSIDWYCRGRDAPLVRPRANHRVHHYGGNVVFECRAWQASPYNGGWGVDWYCRGRDA